MSTRAKTKKEQIIFPSEIFCTQHGEWFGDDFGSLCLEDLMDRPIAKYQLVMVGTVQPSFKEDE